MDISNKFQKVRVLFTNNGFVAVLEKVARTLIAPVKPNSMACEQPSHDGGQLGSRWAEKQVSVIGHECPCQAISVRFWQQFRQSCQKRLPVLVIEKNLPSLDPSDNDMLKNSRDIQSSGPWHSLSLIREGRIPVNILTTSPFYFV